MPGGFKGGFKPSVSLLHEYFRLKFDLESYWMMHRLFRIPLTYFRNFRKCLALVLRSDHQALEEGVAISVVPADRHRPTHAHSLASTLWM